jgi:ubiquinone/menaquinone biosynthesis C-methylase UbiE
LCHAEVASEVLDVGCGIGAGAAYIARTQGCHVVAVHLSPRMIEWARRRTREEGVANRVDLQVADVLDLPFETDRFDAIVAESVLAFVGDKDRALQELVRVTRPGGYVG